MKPLVFLLQFFLAAVSVSAQYSLGWSTGASGGGLSAGGSFSLYGTVAQPAATARSSDGSPGGFSLEGGYWTFPELTAPVPLPALTFDSGFVILTWAEPEFPVVLEFSDDLGLWAPVHPRPAANAWAEPERPRRFYRLRTQP
jgi:hypothetical protein